MSDGCVFGSEYGLSACSHMLFYPSIASGIVGRPPSLLHLLLHRFFWLTISLSLLLPLSLPPPPPPLLPSLSLWLSTSFRLSLIFSLCLEALLAFVCLVGQGGVCLFSPLPSGLIPPSASRERDEKEACQHGNWGDLELKGQHFPPEMAVLEKPVNKGNHFCLYRCFVSVSSFCKTFVLNKTITMSNIFLVHFQC